MKRFFNNINTWTPVWLVALLAFVMILIYVPTFSNMLTNMEDLPVLIVNEDQGGMLHEEEINLGKNVEASLLESSDVQTLEWTNIDTREEALDLLNSGKAIATLVIPANYTESIGAIENSLLTNQSGIETASVEVVVNEASGQSAIGVTTGTVSAVIDSISNSITTQLSKELASSDNQLSAENAILLAQPLVANQTIAAAVPLTDNGMSSFILGMVMIIAGMMSSSMIKSYVNGVEKELQPLNKKRNYFAGLHAEIIFGLCLAVLTSILLMTAVFGIYGVAHTTNLFIIFLFMVLGIMTMFMFYTMFSVLVGLKWSLLINFPLNIMGIMASGGSISLYGLPSFVHFFSYFYPSRYIMDGLRSLVYYNGRMDAGLGTALLVLGTYLVISTIGCYLIYYNRRPKMEK